ncbi:MAG TPA: hypothetical protein VEM77_10270, partial [Thermoplasmata archaeon]|nr:hypothetical protein [Thermoplasmata archaeon]
AARFVFAESGADERLFRAWADGPGRSYGLEPDDFGQEFTTEDGKRFKIVGLNPRARTGIIRATSLDDGGDWRFSGDAVMEALGRTRPEPVPVPEGRPF